MFYGSNTNLKGSNTNLKNTEHNIDHDVSRDYWRMTGVEFEKSFLVSG